MNSLLRRLHTEEIAGFHPAFLFSALESEPSAAEIKAAEHPGMQRVRDMLKPQRRTLDGGVAILPIHGPIARKPDPFEMMFYGIEDSSAVLQMIQEAHRDSAVSGVILDIDSPGGMVTGGLEVSDAVAAMEADKPVVAYSSGIMASMAYHIASRAGHVSASRSAQVGSIGTIISWLDVTERLKANGIKPVSFVSAGADLKTAGAAGTEMTEAQRAYFQARVDSAAAEFHASVAQRRGPLSAEAKRGGMFFAEAASAAGLIDSTGSMDWAVQVVRERIRESAKTHRSR